MIIETGVFLCIIILYSGKAKQDGGIELKQCRASTFDDLWHFFLSDPPITASALKYIETLWPGF